MFHPWHLAEQMDDEISTIAALLHDVVEDTDWTLEQLEAEGFPPESMEALGLLTHPEGQPYMEYVAGLRHNSVAVKVKLADLRHNSDFTRLSAVTAGQRARLEQSTPRPLPCWRERRVRRDSPVLRRRKGKTTAAMGLVLRWVGVARGGGGPVPQRAPVPASGLLWNSSPCDAAAGAGAAAPFCGR